jgi:nucleoside phosphorylase
MAFPSFFIPLGDESRREHFFASQTERFKSVCRDGEMRVEPHIYSPRLFRLANGRWILEDPYQTFREKTLEQVADWFAANALYYYLGVAGTASDLRSGAPEIFLRDLSKSNETRQVSLQLEPNDLGSEPLITPSTADRTMTAPIDVPTESARMVLRPAGSMSSSVAAEVADLPPYTTEDQPWYGALPEVSNISSEEMIFLSEEIYVLLLTATDLELDAVLRRLAPFRGKATVLKGFNEQETYYVGTFGTYPAVVTKCRMGSLDSGSAPLATQHAVGVWRPRALVMVGIAFGKDPMKQKIADVLIASSVISYEPQRVGENESVSRGPMTPANPTLLNRFDNVPHWSFFRPDGSKCKHEVGPVLSGEKLVDDPNFKRLLFARYPQAIGGDMEGVGLAAAALRDGVPWILVKGICDWADGKKHKKHQPLAAAAAVSLVHQVFSHNDVLHGLDKRYSASFGKLQALPNNRGQIVVGRSKSLSRLAMLISATIMGIVFTWFLWDQHLLPQNNPNKPVQQSHPGRANVVVSLEEPFYVPPELAVPFNGIPRERRLEYIALSAGDSTRIAYRMPYLDNSKQGRPILGVDRNAPFAWSYPRLSVRVFNESQEAIKPLELVFDVSASHVHPEPVMIVLSNTYTSLLFINEGWSEPIDPKVRFRFAALGIPGKETKGEIISNTPDVFEVPILKYVPEELATEEVVTISGSIEYGAPHDRNSVPFETNVRLNLPVAASIPNRPTYETVRLEGGKVHRYTRQLPDQGRIKPGEDAGFIVPVASDRTATYHLSVIMYEDDQGHRREVGRRHMELGIFVPRSQVEKMP